VEINQTASVASTVRAELARRSISQGALATKLGKSQAWVSRRLSGDVEMRVDELRAIAALLGVPVADLIGSVAA
jgi:transcriptional regulator with XRE-family HTH domain